MVNEREIKEPCRLAQGAVITLGGLHKFRFNHPAEAAILRERRRTSDGGLVYNSTELNSSSSDIRIAGASCHENGNGTAPRQQLEEQQWYIECLREEIQMEQKRAERDLEREQACLRQQHTEIKQWILQEKQRLETHREKGTLESGVQTDLILHSGLSCQMTEEQGSAERVPPSPLMGDRKRVVQEELLKHHALRRAENRVRRKRLHYQLEKIARKRHLLEAKRELQRLEKELLEGGDEASSPDLGYLSKSRGRPMTLRRHSFSADLLSRLYPQHTPIFSQFLKRNRSSEITASLSGFACATKWESDECLRDQKIRRRSNTMPSRYDQGSSSLARFSDSNKSPLKVASSTEATKLKTASSRLIVKKSTSDEDKNCLDSNTKATRKVLPIIKQKSSVKGTKTLSQGGNKGLETIRKVFSHSVGSGIRSALTKVFRKPPSGSRGHRSVKSVNKMISQFNDKSNKNKTVKDFEQKQEKCPIKPTMSYESLEQLNSLKNKQRRHWHSAEVLTSTKQWVAVQKETAGWVEHSGWEDPNGSSDCDSIFSLDSLSSAYATALAEQLKQEECDSSDAESEDSQISQDSLVMESSGKHVTARPVLRFKKVPSYLSTPTILASCSSQAIGNKEQMRISKDVPAEVFWSLNGSQKLKTENGQGMAREPSHISCLASESRPCSGASMRETENPLALTDAWSSTDAADSPRIIRASGHLIKQDPHTLMESSRCQSSTSLDLFDNMNASESQSSPRSDSTQDGNTTLEEQNDTSFENTLLLESDLSFIPGQEIYFKELTTSAGPCTTHTVCESTDSSDGVADPTTKYEPLNPTVTEALLINSCSKDGEISISTTCFPVNSNREALHVREEPSSSPLYPEDCSLKSNLNLAAGYQVSACDNAGDPEVKNSKAGQILNESHNNASTANGKTIEQCHEEKYFYTKQCTEMVCTTDTKDYALTIEQSDKPGREVNRFGRDGEHFGVQLENEPVIRACKMNDPHAGFGGNMKLPKKSDEYVSHTETALLNIDQEQSSACSTTNAESVKKISLLENWLTPDMMENSDQELEGKEIQNAPSAIDDHKTLISKDHVNTFRNDSSVCDSGLTQTNCTSLKSSRSPEIKNIIDNSKEDRKDAGQIVERKANNRYFQMSDSAINDKISEVVKEHFMMSLREDYSEDQEPNTKKENTSSAKLDNLKSKTNKNEFNYESTQAGRGESNSSQTFSCMSKSEIHKDNSTVHLDNGNAQTEPRHSLTLKDHPVLNSSGTEEHIIRMKEKKVEQESPKCGYVSDNMESVLYCTIEEQSTDELKTSESVLSCVKETIIDVNTSRENIVVCTQLRKDYVDASNPVQRKDYISEGVLEGGRVTVLKPLLFCPYAQDTLSLKLTNGLEKVQKVNQYLHQNAQVFDNKTKLNESALISKEMNNCDNKTLSHGHSRLLNETLCSPNENCLMKVSTPVKSSKCKIPQVSLSAEATVKHTVSGIHSEYVADTFQQTMEAQNKKTCSYNSSISSMEDYHSTVDGNYPTPEARPLSNLAFYEFGPGNLGKHNGCVSQDKTCTKHSLETATISSNCDKDKERPVEHILNGYSEDLRKDATISDLSQAPQRIQMHNLLKTCDNGKINKYPQSENQSINTSNQMEMVVTPQYNDVSIKEMQSCDNQQLKNQVPNIPKNHQSTCMQKREPGKSVEVYHNAKQTHCSQNTKEYYNNTCKSTDRAEHVTAANATKHFVGNGNDDRWKGKQKRYRKAHFIAPPSSSTDSAPDLSLDESTTSKSRVSRTKPSSQTNLLPTSQNALGKYKSSPLDEQSISSPSAISPRSLEAQSGHRYTQQPIEILSICSEAEIETIACQQDHGSSEEMQKIEMTESKGDKDITLRKNASSEDISVCVEDHAQPFEETVPQTRDSAMHFASSDINPFIHSRTTVVVNTAVHKKQAFGSAANLSCKHSPLSSSNKNMTRCCSVDNGLNIQDSPFSSHLSAYVNHKGLSSTLSSNEYSRDQISSEPLLKAASYSSSSSNKQTLTALKCDSYNGASEELRHSSGQVDEIVLVYSSEYESQEHPSPSRCDQGTQTIEVNKDLKRKSRHRRSSTQTPVSKPGNGAPTTWTSLQNMSEHLSDLIHNTSDLLGNIQCMRTGEKPPKYDQPKHSFQVSSGSNYKRDCCTQTSLDIGVQTENAPRSTNATAHEVNVIVKVIGSDICNVSQLDGDAKILKNKSESEQAYERIKSLPDLRPKSSKVTESQNFLIPPQKLLSLETVVPNQDAPTLEASEGNTVDNSCKKSSSSYLGAKRLHMKQEEKQTYHRNVDLRNCFNKQIMLMDRACSPILTVKAARYTQQRQVKTTQASTNHKIEGQENQYSHVYNVPLKGHKMSNHENKILDQENLCIIHSKNARTASTSVSSVTYENLSCSNLGGSDDFSNSICPRSKCIKNERNEYSHEVEDRVISKPTINRSPSQPQRMSLSPPSSTIGVQLASSSDNVRQSKMETLERPHLSTVNSHLSHRSSGYIIKSWDHSKQSTVQQQEDDVMSLVPSECNTDVLVNINPLAETSMLKEHQEIPDDLPMHNKFTNWSGINQHPPSTHSKIHRPTGQHFTKLSSSYWQEPSEKTDRRAQEIEKLKKERERILASVHMDLSPHQLTVELTEAKLHYGQGETDTLLKILKSGSKEPSSACNKQELLNRHRKSIESLRKDREARLQMCRRARSLSPSKHRIPINYEEQFQRVSDLPSRRREYLQQLRQEIVQTSRVPDPPRREGQCPSDIELLLRDYSRAREEARAEIARARDRLRERTEQEKRRLQQQALSQAVKDDLRFRTRISNSTLCSGSNLSLSSGPTSGYNSSNAAILKDITSPLIQVNGVSEFKVRTRPPVIPLQTSKAQRRWLSVQDVSLETSVTGYEAEFSSTPSSPPCARQRTLSFGSPSSISTSYQDIADCTLASAISEVYLASGGDARNLLAGKAVAGWRHQGVERGVQVFHKATSRPSAHGFLGAVELERPLVSLWSIVRDHAKTHLYHESIKSAWTRPLDESTQLVYLLTDVSNCQLKQSRDFCCLSTESKQDDMWVLAMQSVFEETLPRPSVDTIRGEILPSAWILQPSQRNGREVVTVIYLLQVDLGSPSLAPRLLNTVSRKQAAVIADLDSFFSL
ncbi:stAR-related lipid transfer protein 9 isoform X2 [Onychostoma macrolepis]|nr:stAR-related lipid transfer protein 9 isoform X2 [Onychostoma macrolepis]